MTNIPQKIYLQVDADGFTPEDFKELSVTWSSNRIHGNDIEYVLASTKDAEIERLKGEPTKEDVEDFRLLEEYYMKEKLEKTIRHALTKVPESNRESFIINLCNGMIGSAILHHHNRYVKKINVPDFKTTFK